MKSRRQKETLSGDCFVTKDSQIKLTLSFWTTQKNPSTFVEGFEYGQFE
jgi:hypothetical protein